MVQMTVKELYKLMKQGKININKRYQRSFVWKKRQKQLFMDSVIRNYPVGSLLLWSKHNSPQTYELTDGQQRLRTLTEFLDSKFPTHSGISTQLPRSLDYRHMTRDQQLLIENTKIPVVMIEATDSETIRDIFWRLQEGSSLTFGERIHAISSPLARYLRHIGETNILVNTIPVDHTRFKDLQMAAFLYFAVHRHLQLTRPDMLTIATNPATLVDDKEHFDRVTEIVYRGLKLRMSTVKMPGVCYCLASVVSHLLKSGKRDFYHLSGFYDLLKARDESNGVEEIYLRHVSKTQDLVTDYLKYENDEASDATKLNRSG